MGGPGVRAWLQMGTRPGKVVCVWPAVTFCERLSCQGWYRPVLGFGDWPGAAGVHPWACSSSLPWERKREKTVGPPDLPAPIASHEG